MIQFIRINRLCGIAYMLIDQNDFTDGSWPLKKISWYLFLLAKSCPSMIPICLNLLMSFLFGWIFSYFNVKSITLKNSGEVFCFSKVKSSIKSIFGAALEVGWPKNADNGMTLQESLYTNYYICSMLSLTYAFSYTSNITYYIFNFIKK